MMLPLDWWRRIAVSGLRRLIPQWRDKETKDGRPAVYNVRPTESSTQALLKISPEPIRRLTIAQVGIPDTVKSVLVGPPSDSQATALPATAVQPCDRRYQPLTGGVSRGPASASSLESLSARLSRVLALPYDSLLPGPTSVVEWPGELMPFQDEGTRALVGSQRLLLADDMGLGKTIQAIVALRVLFLRSEIETALVVAPTSVLNQWRKELLKWAPDLRAMVIRGNVIDRAWQWATPVHVTIVGYETLRSDFGNSSGSPLQRKTWSVVVADEAQRIKNRNSTSEAVKMLRRNRSWALTGTPLENSEDELASIIEFVDYVGQESPKRYTPGPALMQRHRELQLRRKKTDVLRDLPAKITTKISIELLPGQRHSYDRAEQEGIIHLRELGKDVKVQHILELIARLKQICNAEPETGISSKFEDIRSRIETLAAEGNRALVFSQYTNPGFGVEAVTAVLHEFAPLSFTGAHSLEERREIISRFRKDDRHKVLVLSLRAGGVGLNLQEASYVFHLDRWWNPAVERQAEDRSHRYGQNVPVHVFKYSCIDTIEERIDRILERKQELFDELVDDVSIDLAASLTASQLFGLFGLEVPTAAADSASW